MKRLNGTILALLGVLIITSPALAGGKGWMVDFEAAKKKAAKENKDLLLEFTGSDWCPPCKALKKNVFDTEHFKTQAPKNYILVMLDFPRDKSHQSKEEIAQNQKLQKVYAIAGYPTVILTDAKGVPFHTMQGFRTDPKGYVKSMDSKVALRVKRDDNLKAAKSKKGTARAIALDKAISALDNEIIMAHFKTEVEEIIKIDAANDAGLKKKYEGIKEQIAIKKDLDNLMRSARGDKDKIFAGIDKLIKERNPKGEALQGILFAKSSIYFQAGKKDKAEAGLRDALNAAPKSEQATQIRGILKRFFPNSKTTPKKG